MAKVGEQLLQPEAGWKRFDCDSDIKSVATTNFLIYSGRFYCDNSISFDGYFKFNFIGTKIRIIAMENPNGNSNSIKIKIDENEYYYSTAQGTSTIYNTLNFEMTNLKNQEHYVKIENAEKKWTCIYAIDINENGILKPYSEPSYLVTDKINIWNDKEIVGTYPPSKQLFLQKGVNDISKLILLKNLLSKSNIEILCMTNIEDIPQVNLDVTLTKPLIETFSDDAEIVMWTNENIDDATITKDVVLNKKFIETLSNPKLVIAKENDEPPKLLISGNKSMKYDYKVDIDKPSIDLKNMFNVNYDIDKENVVVESKLFKQAVNPYNITVTVKQDNETTVSNSTKVTLYDTKPNVKVNMTGMVLNVDFDDDENDKVKFKVLLNGIQIHPSGNSFTELMPTPNNYTRKFKSNETRFNASNIVTVIVQDEFEQESRVDYEFKGTYSGLMFMDEKEKFYSDDLGNILSRIDFGNILAGQKSKIGCVYLKNSCGYPIKNITLEVVKDMMPKGANVLIDYDNKEFKGNYALQIEKMENGDKIPIYIQISTTPEMEQGGIFEITANSESTI